MRSNIDDKELQHIMKQVMKDIQKDFHDPTFWEKSDREVEECSLWEYGSSKRTFR